MANTQNTVTVQSTSATLVLAANTWRRGFNIYNNGSVAVYLGFDTTVTTSTGTPILPNASFTSDGYHPWKSNVYAIAASSTADVRYLEWTK